MNKIQISVVIPAYNEEKFLPKCLNSLKKQKTSLKHEIIVVNNNSKDKTEEVARKYGVRVINEKKQGVGQARKTGTEKAKGEIIVHIDADTVVFPDYLEKIWAHFQKDKKLVCLGGQFLFYDAPLWKNILRKILYPVLFFLGKVVSKGGLGPTGGNMAFRKEAYEKTEGFNPCLKFGEDGDLSLKLKKLGKVKVDMNLKCKVSARRFKINKNFWLYSINFLSLCFRKKPYKNILPECKT
jgi:glycosyltransferase involved in cell wall biosynthesis